jgi:hypothetical protein
MGMYIGLSSYLLPVVPPPSQFLPLLCVVQTIWHVILRNGTTPPPSPDRLEEGRGIEQCNEVYRENSLKIRFLLVNGVSTEDFSFVDILMITCDGFHLRIWFFIGCTIYHIIGQIFYWWIARHLTGSIWGQCWNLEQSIGTRNRVRIGLSYRPTRLHRLAESIPGLQKSFKNRPRI